MANYAPNAAGALAASADEIRALHAHIATLEAELEKERFIDGADSRQDRLKGRLCVQGTRFPVWSLLGELAGGSSIEVIANNFSLDVDALAKVLWAMSQKYAQEPPHDA